MSEHRRVLGWRRGSRGDGDHHADGGYLHAWMPVLRGEDVQRASPIGPGGAGEYGAGGGRVGHRLRGADVGGPRRLGRFWCRAYSRDDLGPEEAHRGAVAG